MLSLLKNIIAELYRQLSVANRFKAVGLVAMMVVSGVLEIFGIISLLGYIMALMVLNDPASGMQRGEIVLSLYRTILPDPSLMQFSIIGGIGVLAIFCVKNAFATYADIAAQRFIMREHQAQAEKLYRYYLTVSYVELLRRGTATMKGSLTRQYRVYSRIYSKLLGVLRDGIILAAFVAMLLYLDAGLTAVICFFLGGGMFALHRIGRHRLHTATQDKQEARQDMQRVEHEGLNGMLDMRLHDMSRHYIQVYRQSLKTLASRDRRQETWMRMPRAVNETFFALAIVAVVIYFVLVKGSLSEIISVLALFGFIGLRALPRVTGISTGLQFIEGEASNFEVFKREQHIDLPVTKVEESASQGRLSLQQNLELQHVRYCYPGAEKAVLDDVSLAVRAGQFVSICGKSGCGKSTLMLLLMGMITPDEGQVTVDGQDIQAQLARWYASIGYVSQTPFILPQSIRENVAFGCSVEHIDDDAVWEALEIAQIKDFVQSLPQGLDTPMRDGGQGFSGGQRQRIMIARALYKKPDVLFFDEATSALDAQTEKDVSAAIAALAGARTVICITHRLAAVRESDVIYFMENGQIRASGTYAQLCAGDTAFAAMAE